MILLLLLLLPPIILPPTFPPCTGQELDITIPVSATVKALKAEVQKALGGKIPANKFQIKDLGRGFLKDKLTLARCNVGPNACMEIKVKTRGGR